MTSKPVPGYRPDLAVQLFALSLRLKRLEGFEHGRLGEVDG
jgi:hypothetical protein